MTRNKHPETKEHEGQHSHLNGGIAHRCWELHLLRKHSQQDRRYRGGHQIQDWKGSTRLCHYEASLEQAEYLQLQCEVCFVIRFCDMEAHQSTRLETPSFFVNTCLRQILRIRQGLTLFPIKNSGEERNRDQFHIPSRSGNGGGLGTPYNGTQWASQYLNRKHRRGRPTTTWRRTLGTELRTYRISWGEAKHKAQDRRGWKTVVKALCSRRDEEG